MRGSRLTDRKKLCFWPHFFLSGSKVISEKNIIFQVSGRGPKFSQGGGQISL